MRISEFFVQNFGIFTGSGSSLSGGLTVFYGDNESGKTTLMNFLRRVLFPRERYSRVRNSYDPAGGARQGGSARIIMADGREYVLSLDGRNNSILPSAGGVASPLPPDFFSIGKDVYESVFAIGLDDMQSLEPLNRSEISARFFAAGSGLGSASLPRLLSSLEEKGGELYRPGLSRGASAVNRLLVSMREVDEQARALRERSGSWRERREALEATERSIRERREELSQLIKRASFLDLLEKGLAPRAALGEIERRLGESESLSPFPEGGIDRLERLKDERRRLEAARSRLENEIRSKEQEAAEIEGDPLLQCIDSESEIRSIEREEEQLRAALARRGLLERELRSARENFRRNIEDLCPWWTEEHLAGSDVSAEAVAFARRTAERRETLERKRGEEEKSLAQWNRLREDRRSEAVSLERETGVAEMRARRAEERWELITRLRSVFGELVVKEEELKTLREASVALQSERERALEQKPLAPGKMVALISVFLALVGAGAALQAFLASDYLWAFGSATLFTASLLAWLAQRDLGKKYAASLRQWERRLGDLDSRLKGNAEFLASRGARADRLRAQREEIGGELGVEAPRSAGAMDRLLEQGEDDRSANARFTLLGERNRQMGAVLARMDAEGEAMEAGLAGTANELDELNESWRNWLTERRFDANLAPRDLEGIVPRVLQLRSEMSTLSAREAEGKELDYYISSMKEKINSLAERLAPAFEAAGEAVPVVAAPESIRAFSSLLGRACERRGGAEALVREAGMLRQTLDETRGDLAEVDRKRSALFAAARTADEDAFLALAEEWRKREALQAGRLQERKVLLGLFGSEEALLSAEEEYSFRPPQEIRSEAEEARERIESLRSQVDELADARGRITSEIERMGADERLGALLLERKSMERRLDDLLEEWLANLLARHFLEVSRAKHERERQPEVIKTAAEYLSLMTGDRYLMLSKKNKQGLSVVLEEKDLARMRKEEFKWSSGLADQVYLSMRLALASLWGRNSEPLPLMLDDLLVRFDDGRQEGAARAICNSARENQALMFTCQGRTLEILREVASAEDWGDMPPSFIRIGNGGFEPID